MVSRAKAPKDFMTRFINSKDCITDSILLVHKRSHELTMHISHFDLEVVYFHNTAG